MTEHASPSLAAVYAGWDRFQRDLLAAVTPLSPEQWALPVAQHHWPIARLVQHIAADRAWWFYQWMGEGGAEVAGLASWDDEGQPIRAPAELMAALEASWRMIESALARWTVADLGQVFSPPASLPEAEREFWGPWTLQEIIFHVLRHDIHHGGELAVGMGGQGLPTIWAR
ncbi:MAG TPA: DinB family protein [Ktedonobacterales bacterium]